ncbi:MAG TPA: hypothetical protein VIK13_13490 [Candidatus Limnocylindrales bacterium]
MIADPDTRDAVIALVNETYRRLSRPDSGAAALLAHPDIAVAGSGMGELAYDAEAVRGMADAVSSWGLTWSVEKVTV